MVKFTEYSIIIFLERWEEVGRSKRDKAIKIKYQISLIKHMINVEKHPFLCLQLIMNLKKTK